MRLHSKFSSSIAALVLLSLTLCQQGTANASSLSTGCAYVNANGSPIVDNYISFTDIFNAGEVVTVTTSGLNDFIYISIPVNVAEGGYAGNSLFNKVISWTVPTTGSYDISMGADYYSGDIISFSCGLPGSAGSTFQLSNDGRLNNSDSGETFAVYCTTDGSVMVLGIDPTTSNGFLAFVATPIEIAKVPTKPTTDTAIKSGNGATLYRLTSGELQVNRLETTGKMYAYIFTDCSH